MKRILIICHLLLATIYTIAAQTPFEQANAAYAEGQYANAADLYQSLLEADASPESQPLSAPSRAEVYYNLGNAMYKQGELAQAIIAYERALRLRPNYKEAKYNLAFAQSRITDNIPEQDFFLTSWVRTLRNSFSEQTWVICSITLFIVAMITLLLFLLGRELWLRKTGFHITWIALLLSLIAGLNGLSLHRRDSMRNEAIITQGIVNAKASPDRSGTDLFSVHEGTKVTIRETIGEWANIHVGNNEGWIRLQALERI